MRKTLIGMLLGLYCFVYDAAAQIPYPGKRPGKAQASASATTLTLENDVLKMNVNVVGGSLLLTGLTDKATGFAMTLNVPVFELELPGDKKLSSSSFRLLKSPVIRDIIPVDTALRHAGRQGGKKLEAELYRTETGLNVRWEASLTDGANYIRQTITLTARDTFRLSKVVLISLPGNSGIKSVGTVDGSPLVFRNMFFALEHPMALTQQARDGAHSYLPRLEPLSPGRSLAISAVWGVTPANQLRRGFLYYVERERAHPYRQMLHYNSWFDISWGDRKLNEEGCLDRIRTFGDSLIVKRKVPLSAFLFDDGWDDNKTLWQFNSGFPNGFSKLKETAAAYHAGIGVWISPWGGYDVAKEQRLDYGKKQQPPFETNENGFSLSGPVYNKRFRSVTDHFIRNFNVSMFKFDGVGAGNGASGASVTYQKDIESFLDLITGMRQLKPDLYFSLTVGTWPSVYWLNYGDAIWRAGEDTGLSGRGFKRQQWINYRDAQTYKNIVRRAPLYPLNAVMNHGICIADNGLPGELEMDDRNIADEIWSFFGTGTSLQELYINPHKLTAAHWDCLRDAANWAKGHEQILRDVHWVGGDPDKEEIYGFAAWCDQKGVLTLRNPSPVEKTFTVNVRNVFEIPADLTDNYRFYDARSAAGTLLLSGRILKVTLKPCEVKVMNAEKVQ